ncbi:transcriptional regulatory protein [Sporosarcina sp. NCCP-2716]|uniref:response regulator n=1 Tax=Sporosarcina sp. NCCP-2716 TaxID=2943679 RepID=UPI0020412F48|nr:response regulator [Sporosarcina sp. NCCP-2716]GKV69223.1 transcriptional regulatory protein [Sporosarcina sp. NCCP-2716]
MGELTVFIIEDDFRVADVNRQQVEQLPGYRVAGCAKTMAEAFDILEDTQLQPDLFLLDVYIPDSPGLALFRELRIRFPEAGIVFLTAAKETGTIGEALRGGAFDYLLKPVSFERLQQTFSRFRQQHVLLSTRTELFQQEIDLMRTGGDAARNSAQTEGQLPKGIDRLTLDRIADIIRKSPAGGMNASDVGTAAGVSRSTARRYLEHLTAAGQVKAQLNYGDVGRPERKYIPSE